MQLKTIKFKESEYNVKITFESGKIYKQTISATSYTHAVDWVYKTAVNLEQFENDKIIQILILI